MGVIVADYWLDWWSVLPLLVITCDLGPAGLSTRVLLTWNCLFDLSVAGSNACIDQYLVNYVLIICRNLEENYLSQVWKLQESLATY